MRDMAGKIAELKFEAPLARFEEEDTASLKNMNLLTEQLLDASLDASFGENCNANEPPTTHENGTDILQEGTFSPFSGSLEDLVNTFDEKITSCFRDYGTDVESLAPVQVRTQEEIMNECQMWWTITGTFGNILPIDWSKSYARKMHMPALNLNEAPASTERPELEDLSSEDEAVATDLDMHALILSSSTDTHSPEEPLKTAEEVLREIDDIMQESPSMERSPDSEGSLLDSDEALERSREVLGSPLHEKKLKQLSSSQLTELFGEMESLVAALSETLIAELALRDELEYEKELKNQFISLLLAVQNRRRQHHVTKKRSQIPNGTSPLPQHRSLQEPKYLTTVIPYHTDSGPPGNQALQVLIKILKAISEDSPTVPTLLTDYILKVKVPGRDQNPQAAQAQVAKPKGKPKKVLPKTINQPTRLAASMSSDIKLNNKDPACNTIFEALLFVREVNLDTRFDPSTPALIEIARLCYTEFIIDDINAQKLILPEYLDYYATAMLWFRMISLKAKLLQPITQTECDVLLLIENLEFSIPEPLMIQLKTIGSIETITREYLTPTIPDLPTSVVAGHGGYYGAIDAATHNLYEEIPCLGVTSEAVRQSVSNAASGPYISSLTVPDQVINQNLLGFKPLGYRQNEAKNLAFDAGITQDNFPKFPQNTGLNMELLRGVSAYLAQTKAFRVTTINIHQSLTDEGSLMQAVIQRPQPPTNAQIIEKLEDIEVTSLMKDQLSIYGASIMYCPQLLKVSSTPATAHTWCCINEPPQVWIDNRNDRRTIPSCYQREVFRSSTRNGQQYRMATIRQMLLTKP